jgi:hypothetical protein
MTDCQPLITPEFLHTVTGVDVSDPTAAEAIITIASTLIGEELGACVDPASASMKIRMVCAQYTAFCMGDSGGASPSGIRAEQVGDYRIEYQSNGDDRFNLQVLRDMLASMYGGSSYSVGTLEKRRESLMPQYEWFNHSQGTQQELFYDDGPYDEGMLVAVIPSTPEPVSFPWYPVIPQTPEVAPPAPDTGLPATDGDLLVDLYQGVYVRVRSSDPILYDHAAHWMGLKLATEPGPEGAVFADTGALRDAGGEVWFDRDGNIGKMMTNVPAPLAATNLATWLDQDRVVQVLIDGADHLHPNLNIITTKVPHG